MFQTSAKSRSNIESCDFFVKIWKKSRHVRTGCFLSKFRFYSDLRQISKYSNVSHAFSCIRRTIPTIHLLTSYFPGHFCKSESRYSSRAVSLVQFSPKYPSTRWKWKIRNDLDGKHLRNEIKKGPSKSSPNSFQIKNLEDEIWTFEQIDDLRQAPIIRYILLILMTFVFFS